jgi:predicted nucleic acid-binding protein
LSSEVQSILNRLKWQKRRGTLKLRPRSGLPFLGNISRPPAKLLYDTTVYIDILQGHFPADGDTVIRAVDAYHSPVTEAELIFGIGRLDPEHSATAENVAKISEVIDKRPSHRSVSPDQSIWRDAGAITAILSRLQGYSRADRQRLLNDALIFCTARKHGLTVLTRNISDFDLLQQIDPAGKVLFYERK